MSIDAPSNITSQKLFRALSQFHRAKWHEHTIAGCKPSEIRVLFCIKQGMKTDLDSPIKVSEISKQLQVTSPTITQLLKGLEANGFVERRIDPNDRRAVGIILTEKGEMVTKQAADTFFTTLQGLIEFLGEEQSDELAELLSKVFRYFNEKAAIENNAYWNGDEKV